MSVPTDPSAARVPSVQLAVAMALAGTLGLFVKKAGIGAVDAVFWRCLIGAAVMAAYVSARGLWRQPFGSRRDLVVALAGGISIVANWVLAFAAFDYVSITLMTIVYHVQPFFVLGLAFLAYGERVTRVQVAWVGLAFAGLVLAIGFDPELSGDPRRILVGAALGLGSAFLYACAVIAAKGVRATRPEVLTATHALIGAVVLYPLTALSPEAIPAASWPWLAGLGIFHTGLVYVLMYAAYPRLPSATIAVLTFVYPVTALLSDATVFGTRITTAQIAGMGLIALATLAVQRGWTLRRRVAHPRP